MDYTVSSRLTHVHKGQCGKIGIIAGSLEYPGAAILAGQAALRTGAGVVYLLTTSTIRSMVMTAQPELIVKAVTDHPYLTTAANVALHHAIKTLGITQVIIGPGLGGHADTQAFVKQTICEVLPTYSLNTLIDADAITALSPDDFCDLASHYILTPHEGEFMRFSGCFPQKRGADSGALARKINQIIVLKGPCTVITDGQVVHENPTGNAGMATAGSGDVLAGVIMSLVGQGCSLFKAAYLGAYIHGLAGDTAFRHYGNGLIASDIIRYIPDALLSLSS